MLKKNPHLISVFVAISAAMVGLGLTGHFGFLFAQTLASSNMLLSLGSIAGGVLLSDFLFKISSIAKCFENEKGHVISINDQIDEIKDKIYK